MEQTTESSTVDRGPSRFGTAQAAPLRRLQPVSVAQSTDGTRTPFDIFVDQEMETLSVSSTMVSQQFVDRFREGLEVRWRSMSREELALFEQLAAAEQEEEQFIIEDVEMLQGGHDSSTTQETARAAVVSGSSENLCPGLG